MSTKVMTGIVRLSYPHLAQPRESQDGGNPKYSATLLIPKTDKKTIKEISDAIKEAADAYREKNGASSLPPKPKTTLHDGDGTKDNGDTFGPECKGCYLITCSTTKQPLLLDQRRQEVLDVEDTFYPGCWVRALINFKGYNFQGSKGITAYLNGIQFAKDGEPLGEARASAADFEDIDIEYDDSFDDLLA